MIERFLQLLSEASAAIPPHYFNLPVAGQADAIYRERVYCYELYHQLRTLLESLEPDDPLTEFALNAEIDKQHHPFIEHHMPDYVFHVPGIMERNLVVIEVKPINARPEGIRKDMETLAYFTSDEVGYECGIQLVYGDNERGLELFGREFPKDNPKLRLFWHRSPGTAAVTVPLL
jgi:hypothetical protein